MVRAFSWDVDFSSSGGEREVGKRKVGRADMAGPLRRARAPARCVTGGEGRGGAGDAAPQRRKKKTLPARDREPRKSLLPTGASLPVQLRPDSAAVLEAFAVRLSLATLVWRAARLPSHSRRRCPSVEFDTERAPLLSSGWNAPTAEHRVAVVVGDSLFTKAIVHCAPLRFSIFQEKLAARFENALPARSDGFSASVQLRDNTRFFLDSKKICAIAQCAPLGVPFARVIETRIIAFQSSLTEIVRVFFYRWRNISLKSRPPVRT